MFHFTCYGGSTKFTKLQLANGKVNKQIGQEKKVRVAFFNNPGWFEIHALTKEVLPYEHKIDTVNGPQAYDFLSPFLDLHNLIPTYQDNAEHVPGVSTEETQGLTGSVGQVSHCKL